MTAAKKIEYGKDFELQVENAATRSSGSFMTLTLGGNEAVLKPKDSKAAARIIELQEFQMFAFRAPNVLIKSCFAIHQIPNNSTHHPGK